MNVLRVKLTFIALSTYSDEVALESTLIILDRLGRMSARMETCDPSAASSCVRTAVDWLSDAFRWNSSQSWLNTEPTVEKGFDDFV